MSADFIPDTEASQITAPVDAVAAQIARRESSGNYAAISPANFNGKRALGKYQIMESNLPSWSKEAIGHEVSPKEFMASPDIQEAIANYHISKIYDKYGNAADTAAVWFSGRPAKGNNAKDVTGTSVQNYVADIVRRLTPTAEAATAPPSAGAATPPSFVPDTSTLPPTSNPDFIPDPQGTPQEGATGPADPLGGKTFEEIYGSPTGTDAARSLGPTDDFWNNPLTALKTVGRALTTNEHQFGTALSTIGSNAPAQADQINTADNRSKDLLLHAIHSETNPAKKEHMLTAYQKIWGDSGPVTAGDINPGFNMTPGQVAGSAAGTALDVLTAGSYGKAAEGAQTGRLLTKAAEPVAEKTLSQTAKAIAGRTLLQSGKGAATGYGYDVSQNLNNGKTGTDALMPGTGTVVGATLPVVGTAVEKALPGFSKLMEKANLRLTPVQERDLGDKVDDVTKFLSEKKIVGTPASRFEKVDGIYNDMEDKLQSFLSKDAKGVTVNKNDLIGQLEELKSKYQDERDVTAIERQIDELKGTLKDKYPGDIPVARLNNLKRSTYQNAYNKAGNKVLDSVEHDIGDVLRTNIETATKGMKVDGKDIGAFNKEYGTVINSKKLLNIAQSRSQLGIFGKVLLGLAGSALSQHLGGGPLGDVAGLAAGGAASQVSTPVRSLLGAGAQIGHQALDAIPNGAKKAVRTLTTRQAGLSN